MSKSKRTHIEEMVCGWKGGVKEVELACVFSIITPGNEGNGKGNKRRGNKMVVVYSLLYHLFARIINISQYTVIFPIQ